MAVRRTACNRLGWYASGSLVGTLPKESEVVEIVNANAMQGQTVAYFLRTNHGVNGYVRPAIVLGVKANNALDLRVFTYGDEDPRYASGSVLERDVPFSEVHDPHTWCWWNWNRPEADTR